MVLIHLILPEDYAFFTFILLFFIRQFRYSRYYKDSRPDWAKEALEDAKNMVIGVETLGETVGGRRGYFYANRQFRIPFGWNANRLKNTATTGWAYLIQQLYHPMVLGGKNRWNELDDFARTLRDIRGGRVVVPREPRPPRQQSEPEPTSELGRDIWVTGTPGEYADRQWEARATHANFTPSIQLRRGQKITITYSLEGSDVLGVQLIADGRSENARGDMIVKRDVGGPKKTLTITVPSDRKVWRITFQYGKNAWGHLGGSVDASLVVHSVELGSGSSPLAKGEFQREGIGQTATLDKTDTVSSPIRPGFGQVVRGCS